MRLPLGAWPPHFPMRVRSRSITHARFRSVPQVVCSCSPHLPAPPAAHRRCHVARRTLHAVWVVCHVARCLLHVARGMLHVACCTWHVACCTVACCMFSPEFLIGCCLRRQRRLRVCRVAVGAGGIATARKRLTGRAQSRCGCGPSPGADVGPVPARMWANARPFDGRCAADRRGSAAVGSAGGAPTAARRASCVQGPLRLSAARVQHEPPRGVRSTQHVRHTQTGTPSTQ